MARLLKWAVIVCAGLLVLVLIALIVVPRFIDVQKYRPHIEERVASFTGRSFTLGGELKLSLFPWVGVSFSDLHLGNPAGFKEKNFVSIKSFDVRVKLFPLFFKDIEINRFVVDGVRIVLEKRNDGRANWEDIGPRKERPQRKVEEPSEEKAPRDALPVRSLSLDEFSITHGTVIMRDQVKNSRREISDVTVKLENVSLDRSVGFALSALVDGKTVSLEGNVGPFGKKMGETEIPLDVSGHIAKQVKLGVKGSVENIIKAPVYKLTVTIAPFSPKKLCANINIPFPVKTTDPAALESLEAATVVRGTLESIETSAGTMTLDASTIKFSSSVTEFTKPTVALDIEVDAIDLDRYLPPPEKKGTPQKKRSAPPAEKKINYETLRKLVLDGSLRINKLKLKNAHIDNVHIKVTGRKGQFTLEPATMDLYKGNVTAKGAVNVMTDVPETTVNLNAQAIEVNPFLLDVLEKDFLEGAVKAHINVSMSGMTAEKIKRSLNGEGRLDFVDGAIKGIDLAGMVRNAKAAFGLDKTGGTKPRTDFTELNVPFTIADGVVTTKETALKSPFVRITAHGNADLVKEMLDMRVEPKFVGTIKGQGDVVERTGIMVPVLIRGPFSAPRFAPDLEGILTQKLEEVLPEAGDVGGVLQKGVSPKPGDSKTPAGDIKELLRDIMKKK